MMYGIVALLQPTRALGVLRGVAHAANTQAACANTVHHGNGWSRRGRGAMFLRRLGTCACQTKHTSQGAGGFHRRDVSQDVDGPTVQGLPVTAPWSAAAVQLLSAPLKGAWVRRCIQRGLTESRTVQPSVGAVAVQ